MTITIGLTGPIGCGKSTVAGWLAARGAVVIDADEVARAVSAPGEPGHDAVLAVFGADVRVDGGTLDRAALARIVFRDPEALRRLEAILHPLVRTRILAAIDEARAASAPAVVVEAIKLVEGGLAALCDEVWLVTCAVPTQRERVIDRGLDAPDADRRIAAQAGLVERVRPVATRVIDTSGPLDDARSRTAAAWAAATEGLPT
ncbi:MAG TPA: dephospho-CoA kinase [Candidatus Limnocylindrales bacterium]|nr:dephospho-CoA kinase [Candidatus Limnocylindrales bacterium]